MGLRDLFRGKEQREQASDSTTFAPPTGPPANVAVTRASRGVAQWVPAGQSIVVDGRTIPGGLLYFGSKAPSLDRYSVEPALIDPALPVRWERPDETGATMGYWPSYHEISPTARAAYLQWLSTGRSNPSAYIGYVFLYFYGLERRAIADTKLDSAHPDTNLIADEVRRLLGIYSTNGSFRGYANSFLSVLEASTLVAAELSPPRWDPDDRSWEVPLPIKIRVGRYIAAGQPIPSNWALSLLLHHPEAYLRTPATRCRAEFDALFTQRYVTRHGAGLVIKPPATKIKLAYRPASGGISTEVAAHIGTLPDVTSIVGPINKLKELASECTDMLDPYSRYLGRNTNAVGTAEAVSLLPDELLATHGGRLIDELRTWTADRLTNSRHVAVPLAELINHWSPNRTEKLAKRDAVALAGLLGKLHVGIEPDVRFGGPIPPSDSNVLLFRLASNAPAAPSSAYAAASSLSYLTAVVASADGTISEPEQRHLAHHIESVLGLDRPECERLEAHLAWLATGKVGMAGIKKRIDILPAPQRVAIGRFLMDVAAADGAVSREEIATLTKMFTQLGLDEADVYRQVHALGSDDAGPVTIRNSEPTTRWEIPSPATPNTAQVRLDPAKVQARLAETASVTALLSTIFADDELSTTTPTTWPPPLPAAPPTSAVAGLDITHSALATAFSERPVWERTDAEQLAASLGLPLLDGAIDRINEAAIEACGDPLIEGDDPLELNDYAKQELF
jgi:uncharacterized tellurite resistance protein B-like protein